MASYQELVDSLELGCLEETERVIRTTPHSTSFEVSYHGLKCMATRHTSLSQLDTEQLQDCVMRQLKLLSRVRHPNIVQFLGVHSGSVDPPLLVYELLPITLSECLSKYDLPPLSVSLTILRDVAQALCCLHHHYIVHGLVSASSVYLGRDMSAKLGEVGTDIVTSSLQSATDGIEPTISVDIHSYGQLMQTLLDLPSAESPLTSTVNSASLKQTLSSLSHQCLQADAHHRPSAPTLLTCVERAVSSLPGDTANPLEVFLRRRRKPLPSPDSAVSSFDLEASGLSVESESPLARANEGASPDLLVDEETLCKQRAEIVCRSYLRRQSTITEVSVSH